MSSDSASTAFQFEQPEQQHQADLAGMWVFLGTEILMFGGLFMAITYYRVMHVEAVHEAASHLHLWIGVINTAVLLTSSFTMSVAIAAARHGRQRTTSWFLLVTAAIGLAFLGIKGFEYWKELHEGLMPNLGGESPLRLPGARLFINMYLTSTALHALHLTIAVCIASYLFVATATRRIRLPQRKVIIEAVGMYWHMVDIVWIFLFPTLYLAGR